MPSQQTETPTSRLFINGHERATSVTTTISNPARPDELVGRAASAASHDVEDAIVAATCAFAGWSSLSVRERASAMRDALDGLAENRDDDARLLTREIGKVLHDSWVDSVVLEARWNLALELVDDVDSQGARHLTTSSSADVTASEVQFQPLGVVTIIVPFNWPLAILGASLPHALLAGNCVIVKPPRTAPLATTLVMSRIAAALPPGVLNVVTGEDVVVQPLIDDPRVAKVCFTGSVAGGKKIMELASRSLTRVTLELGGNDPAIVCADALLDDEHLDRLFDGIFDSAGQICMNVKRLYVHVSRRDELVAGLTARLEQVRLGDGLDETTTMGPLHSAAQLTFIESLLSQARETGADVRQFAQLPEGDLSNGFFVRPALVINPDASLDIVTKEQFGPVIPIMTFEEEEHVIPAANDTWAGLGASVWTASADSAERIARQLQCGYVWINDHGAARLDLRAPFGGMKQSGFGREQGLAGIRDFQDTRVVARSEALRTNGVAR